MISFMTPPNYSKICPTTSLFVFLLKDLFEYFGVIKEKKTLPARIYRNNMVLLDSLQSKIKSLSVYAKE